MLVLISMKVNVFIAHLFAVTLLCGAMLLLMVSQINAQTRELAIADFKFDGSLGSDGAMIEKIATNHFKVTLGHAPQHTDWGNRVQFEITRHARGNALRLDVVFGGGNAYRFNEYFYSWSHDCQKQRQS